MRTAKSDAEINSFIELVCAKTGISLDVMHTLTRKRKIVCIRQGIARAIRYKWEDVTLMEICAYLRPEKPFSTASIIHSIRSFQCLLDCKDKYAENVNTAINDALKKLFSPNSRER